MSTAVSEVPLVTLIIVAVLTKLTLLLNTYNPCSMDTFLHEEHLRSRQGKFGCFFFNYWQIMKEQTTCSASYMNISLMFVLFAEKSFFFLFSPFFFFANACSSQFCPGLNMKCQTTTRKSKHCNILPAQPAAESLIRQLAGSQHQLVNQGVYIISVKWGYIYSWNC